MRHIRPRGATTAKKLRGANFCVPTPGCLRQKPDWVLGAGGDRPPPQKTQMLNSVL